MIAPAFVRVVAVMGAVTAFSTVFLMAGHGLSGLGVSLLIGWASITLGRWLKVRPTPHSAPEHVGLGRLSTCLVLAWLLVNMFLAVLKPSGLPTPQLDTLACFFVGYCAGFITLVIRRPKSSWRRKLTDVAARVRSSLSRPVMGGAGS